MVGQASAVRNTLVGVAKGLVGSASGADIAGLLFANEGVELC